MTEHKSETGGGQVIGFIFVILLCIVISVISYSITDSHIQETLDACNQANNDEQCEALKEKYHVTVNCDILKCEAKGEYWLLFPIRR
jgi:hypothetical protein